MSHPQIFILDDNAEFRASTAWLLEAFGYGVSHFGEHTEALESMQNLTLEQPACLLLDIRMPLMSGLDVHDLMHEKGIDLPVIYMTAHGDVPLAVTAMKKGALTFLEKPLEDTLLHAALDQALSCAVQAQRSTAAEREGKRDVERRLALLTPRERQVVDAIVGDRVNKQIASDLNISVKTVELHRSRALRKLEVRNAAQLVKLMLGLNHGR